MSIDLTRIQIKLDTINSKDKTKILADKIYLPNIGVPKNINAITNWLATASNVLTAIKAMTTVTQVTTAITTIQNGLCITCKANLQKILDSEVQPCATDFDKFRAIRLYMYAVGLR
jgi:hypothetical protein